VGIGEVLTIDSVTRQDGGLYVCTADNGAGSKSRDFEVDVQCMSRDEYIRRPYSQRRSCTRVQGNPGSRINLQKTCCVYDLTQFNSFLNVVF